MLITHHTGLLRVRRSLLADSMRRRLHLHWSILSYEYWREVSLRVLLLFLTMRLLQHMLGLRRLNRRLRISWSRYLSDLGEATLGRLGCLRSHLWSYSKSRAMLPVMISVLRVVTIRRQLRGTPDRCRTRRSLRMNRHRGQRAGRSWSNATWSRKASDGSLYPHHRSWMLNTWRGRSS